MTRSRNGGSGAITDQQARFNIGALEQRVYGLEQGVATLSSQLTGISQQLTAGGKTNWGVLVSTAGFCLVFAGTIGGLAYAPIRENQTDLKTSMAKLAEAQANLSERVTREFVTVRELDTRAERTKTDLSRVREDVQAIDRELVPRAEHTERWRSNEREFVGIQRQIDDLKRFNTDLVSAKDFIKNLDDRMRTLERRPQS